MSDHRRNPRLIRILALAGLILCLVCAAGIWAFIDFNQFYFPDASALLGYFELALWCVLSVYLGAVALRGSVAPWKPS
jgi:hypothetical protein